MRLSRLLAFALIATVLPACAGAEEHKHGGKSAASPASLRGSAVSFPSASGNASGYLALPSGKGRHGALIVIHEWWGLDGWIKQQADRFAGQGYVALAADLYRGKVASDPALAHELMRGLPEDRAMNDLQGAFDYLRSRPDVDPARIGVIGWCMGGGYSLALAIKEPRIAACVINYGRLVTDAKTIAGIHPPILGNFGGADRGIPPADVNAFAAALKANGKNGDIRIFDGAGHAFMNPNNREGYVPKAADEAWKRIDSFLARYIRR